MGKVEALPKANIMMPKAKKKSENPWMPQRKINGRMSFIICMKYKRQATTVEKNAITPRKLQVENIHKFLRNKMFDFLAFRKGLPYLLYYFIASGYIPHI